ncbi:hypothetical protein L3556_15605 [Candidatus Synechococcus calcipolaris G9]|uniref:Uncharacterized protein n=1 Tax=Candidatus Synechococcus calcipolaris G9 TaxID=1497997 RepID=A0ABT6F3F7_9SYNE|nr:hypothetical protein [Candidatus Synechococcus calcipolaris]MDG2992345.1 hypothetical protein [Candidatus Synechococcus calcipolaris G9]
MISEQVTLLNATLALEQHPQSLRLRKLLFRLCWQEWENNPERLLSVSAADLIMTVLTVLPTLEMLNAQLTEIVNTLNKADTYRPLAETLINELGPLYHQAVRSSQPAVELVPVPNHLWFKLRLDIIRYCNSLQLKILIFSVLYHPFSYKPTDWQELRGCVLTDLLEQLFHHYDDYPPLKFQVIRVAKILEPTEDYLVVGDRLLRAMAPIYERYVHPSQPPEEEPYTEISDNGVSATSNFHDQHDQDDATSIVYPPP